MRICKRAVQRCQSLPRLGLIYMTFEELMQLDVGRLAPDDALQRIAELLDLSLDVGKPGGTTRALEWCAGLDTRELSTSQTALLDYFRSNAYANRALEKHSDDAKRWAWEQPELHQQLFFLRRAAAGTGFLELNGSRQCQILTNLGNQMNTVGRFVDALEYWQKALAVNPRFGMALGNRGIGLTSYARVLYDRGHQNVLLAFAHKDLSAALAEDAEYETPLYAAAAADFAAYKDSIEEHLDSAIIDDERLRRHSLGRTRAERAYRQWCLQNVLFVNPLNDIDGTYAIAARDVLTQPNLTVPVHTRNPPPLIGFFGQIKQEFVSARWAYYDGIHSAGETHFSDRDVLLYNTLDYPCYALSVEKTKTAYRVAYSIFDKIAFLLNSYFQLGIAEKQVNFRSIWYTKSGKQSPVVKEQLERLQNWPLRGLFWLSKDLFDEQLSGVTMPDAREMHDIRNHLEHKYFVVREFEAIPPHSIDERAEDIGYGATRADFEAKTLRLLRLVRSALIHLSLSMYIEEKRRSEHAAEGVIMPMPLDPWDDDWKR